MNPATLICNNPSAPAKAPRPNNVSFKGLGAWPVVATHKALSTIQASRTREMLLEDLVGFGFLRTGMDLFRQYFFDNTANNQRKLNISAARERLIREVGSIFTDNFMGGMLAYAMAWATNRFYRPNMANQFASDETLQLFGRLVQQSSSKSAFVNNLARTLAPNNNKVRYTLGTILEAPARRPIGRQKIEDAAVTLAKNIAPQQQSLDVVVRTAKGTKSVFALDTLLEDAAGFLKQVGANNKSWQNKAQSILQETVRINRLRLPVGLGLAMAMTLGVPYLNRYLTRRLDGLDSYPGELGLREPQKTATSQNRSKLEALFPYLSQSVKAGNLGPLVASLIPLPFALGMFDTVKLSNGSLASAINPIGKGYFSRMARLLQFGKGFPFTTQQQMASCFAFLIFSRLTTARSDIEFRERMVDSFLGWAIWILATPRIKKFIANRWDSSLLKQVGNETVLKRGVELKRLVCNLNRPEEVTGHLVKQGMKSPLAKFVVMSAASLGITIALLGIIEPYIAIKWTEWQARRAKPQKPASPFDPAVNPFYRPATFSQGQAPLM